MRQHLGTFELPDGGEMDAYLEGRRLECRWPVLPLSRRNRRYYLRHIGPVIIQRARAALGISEDAAHLWLLV